MVHQIHHEGRAHDSSYAQPPTHQKNVFWRIQNIFGLMRLPAMRDSSWWETKLVDIKVNGKSLGICTPESHCTAVIDTGEIPNVLKRVCVLIPWS